MTTPTQPDEIKDCPYCKTPCKDVSSRGRYVNGLQPVKGEGCEFCNPSL